MNYIRNTYSDLTYQLLSEPEFHAPAHDEPYHMGVDDEVTGIRYDLEAQSHLVEPRAF